MANDSIGYVTVFDTLVNSKTVEDSGRTQQSDIIVGVGMIILSVWCALAYAVILISMWRGKELIKMTSHKFMFFLGCCDVIQCLPHAVTGIFTLAQSTGSYWLAKMMGVFASPFYLGYAMLTVILSFNRFVQIAFPHFEHVLFSPMASAVGVVIGFIVFYMAALLSPWGSNVYHPGWYACRFKSDAVRWQSRFLCDDIAIETAILISIVFLQFEPLHIALAYLICILGSMTTKMLKNTELEGQDMTLPASLYLKKIAMVIERKRIASSRNVITEVKILIQALTITVYCSILNILWYNYQSFLPDDLWILGSGVYPIIYLIVNSAVRGKIVRVTLNFRKNFARANANVDRSKTHPTSITRMT